MSIRLVPTVCWGFNLLHCTETWRVASSAQGGGGRGGDGGGGGGGGEDGGGE